MGVPVIEVTLEHYYKCCNVVHIYRQKLLKVALLGLSIFPLSPSSQRSTTYKKKLMKIQNLFKLSVLHVYN